MKKVLIGAARSKGSFKDSGRKIKYDNIKLYLADYREFKSRGFSIDKNIEPVKIKTVDFEEVSGISVKEFLKNFEKEYMFHRVRVIGEENDYGRVEVIELKFSEDNCFVLWKKLQEERDEDDGVDESEDDEYDEDEDDEEDDDEDEEDEDFDFDIGDVNEDTGEVGVKKVKKSKKVKK